MGSVVVAPEHSTAQPTAVGSRAQQRLSCSMVCGIFPDQGSNLSPALAGGFFSTEPPGSPSEIQNVQNRIPLSYSSPALHHLLRERFDSHIPCSLP